jgi:hypothetical protein
MRTSVKKSSSLKISIWEVKERNLWKGMCRKRRGKGHTYTEAALVM